MLKPLSTNPNAKDQPLKKPWKRSDPTPLIAPNTLLPFNLLKNPEVAFVPTIPPAFSATTLADLVCRLNRFNGFSLDKADLNLETKPCPDLLPTLSPILAMV